MDEEQLRAASKTTDKTDRVAVARLALRAVPIAARPPYAVAPMQGAEPIILEQVLCDLLPHESGDLSAKWADNRRYAQDGMSYAQYMGWLKTVDRAGVRMCVVTDKGRLTGE